MAPKPQRGNAKSQKIINVYILKYDLIDTFWSGVNNLIRFFSETGLAVL
jgi:hypothetical protein